MSLAGSVSSQPPSARSSMSTDSASDSDNESLLPTPHTAAVPTFHIHEPGTTPDRRNSTMSHGSDMLRGGRSSSESERLVARRQRKKGGQAEAVLDGAPGFGRSRSNGRTPAVIKVDDVAGLDAGHPENDASFTASPSTSTPIDPAPKGLNIPGLNLSLAGNIISRNFTDILPTPGEEASDVLSSLVPSPRKAFVSQLQSYESRAANARDAPVSPAWGSFDPVKPVFPQRDRASGSMGPPAVPSWATRRASGPNGRYMDMDMADAEGPSPKSGAPATFEEAPVPIADPTSPVPTHTHARNLSINFPHPGQAKVQHEQTVAPVAAAGKGEGFKGADGAFAFGAPLDQNTMEGQRAGKRRGHHHKHSLSHNFFSFLDPTKTDSTVDEPAHAHGRRQSIVSRKVSDAPLNVPMPLQDSALSLRLNSIATSSSAGSMSSLSAFTNKSDPMSQLLSSFALLEFIIGAALWVEGQMGGYRCLAGIGYLVVFDAMGVGVGVVARGGEGWRSVRTPYGMTRFLSLLYFSQCLFLVFSAVYIAKESLEQVVLGGHEHGGHSHGHAEHEDERPFPTMLLLCAMLSSALGGGVMHSHAKLVDAVGSLFLSSTYLSSPLVKRFPHLLANPFSLTVTAASGMLLLAGLVIPQHALSTLDGFAALVLTILTTALSLPPTKAFGQILLQTAPSGSTSQMRSFTRAIREIKDDRRVLGLRQTRCWAITAGSSPPDPATPLFDSPPITPSASSSNITGMLRKQSSFQFNRSETCSHSRDSTAPSSPTIARTSSRPGMPRRSSSAWYSPHGSPTVGEYGGVPSALYPSMRVDEGDAALVITVMLQVDRDMGDNEVVQLTKETWVKLSRVCGGGTRRVGEVCVGVERVDH